MLVRKITIKIEGAKFKEIYVKPYYVQVCLPCSKYLGFYHALFSVQNSNLLFCKI
jgi:predicted nucleic-acid-binding Zn-ribbon protein